MSFELIQKVNNEQKKAQVVDVRSGDTVKVYQKIKEGNKERVQVFEGMVIKTANKGSHTSSITVRRIAGGTGVEKSYLLHSPLVTKIEVMKRGKVRRNYLTYMRQRSGKSARLASVDFDKESVNTLPEPEVTEPEQPAVEAEVVEATEEVAAKTEA